ncbi:uncharacterized protein FMAN_13026 [Fusarium mangiferae]|uniref:Xylanolytic transcriptional activator regulatory domain-containing protein n=1 Tax=Fusarium mangiferae TaxID=192010 RepID=A0A1L7UAS4_FUSMA|nr:uncharacterized protein FMAN_13026 [Fusarium mangiferae]CVL05055.1 uncharacterized protein FMAN_13026 [Fusarium mangiferae]
MLAGLEDVNTHHGDVRASGDSEAASSGRTAGSFQLFDSLTNGHFGSITSRDLAGEELMDDLSNSMTKCDADIQVLGPAELLVTQNGKQSVHIGINSSGATVASCVDDASKAQATVAQPSTADFLIELNHYSNDAGVYSPPAPLCQLPARQIAFECVEGYCRKVNTYYPIIDQEKIRQSLNMMYSEARNQLGALDHCLCYLVISIGSLMNPIPTEHAKTTADLYREAWSLLQDCISSPGELSLQIVLLHVVHYMAVAKAGIAWTYSGLAVRMAQGLGLDRLPSQTSLTSSESKNLWWIALSFDATLSMSQGRPPAVAKIDLSFSKTPGDLETTENGSLLPNFSYIYSWIFQIHTFQNRFCNMIQGSESRAWKLSQIAKLDCDLIQWKDSLPVECRPDNLILVSPERYAHILCIHLEYFNMLRSIHWLAMKLASSATGEAQTVMSGRLKASEAICLEAARSLIKALNEHNNASDGSDWKTCAIVFQVNNYMAAIATLYWSISIKPKSLSARADLELLRAGTIHLQRDTPNTVPGPGIHSMIDNLVIKANDLVWKGKSH